MSVNFKAGSECPTKKLFVGKPTTVFRRWPNRMVWLQIELEIRGRFGFVGNYGLGVGLGLNWGGFNLGV